MTYREASEAMDKAQRDYDAAVALYRAKTTDDATFLLARAIYVKAQVAFDVAFAEESSK